MTRSHREPTPPAISRRRALGLGAAVAAYAVLAPEPGPVEAATPSLPGQASPEADSLRPAIHPRTDWAGDLGVTGELTLEDDVRFLLVHHTASTNDYSADQVVDQIRGFYEFHTGPEKGWPDVAYNFFVDRFGGIWEGRQGSIQQPIRGDATGGSQGFALLCSLIGNQHEQPMTPEQHDALVQLLAWLGATYQVDTTPGASVSFVSRGSNRWPTGAEVTTSTIAGHRDMSTTTCPGDRVYPLLAQEIPDAVSRLRASVATAVPSSTSPPTASTPAETSAPLSSTSSTTAAAAGAAPTTQPPTGEAAAPTTEASSDDDDGGLVGPLLVTGGLAAVVGAVGAKLSRMHASER